MAVLNNITIEISKLLKAGITINQERKNSLNSFAEYISHKILNGNIANLIFICTHNSRRSTMSQIWAQTGAEYFNIPNIKCFSGGTEATAFNPRAVKTVKNYGFKVEQKDESENPIYLVSFSDEKEPITCFSKVYSDKFNPQTNFAAIMTCSDADANCPLVLGAEARFPIKYDDPKEFDNTNLENEKYAERFEQIGIEMLYVFSNVKLNL